jgi:hypothetical protein
MPDMMTIEASKSITPDQIARLESIKNQIYGLVIEGAVTISGYTADELVLVRTNKRRAPAEEGVDREKD